MTRFIEPAWKCLLSNKGLLPLLWEMAPGHPNLLPAYFESDDRKTAIGERFARKPIWSREGANVLLIDGEDVVGHTGGTYGTEGYIRQALVELQAFDGMFPVLGSWLVGDEPAGMGIREDATRVTGNRSRFVPHVIL
jgi:glutathionylspermidine synthase